MHKKILTILFFTLLAIPETVWLWGPVPCFAQVDTAWVRRYNGPGNSHDEAKDIVVDGSGNVYVTGWSSGSGTSADYATIKYYPNGDIAWARRYNGPADGDDGAIAIAVDVSGNVYVTGAITEINYWGDYATIKYYPNGDTAWVRRYNGPADSDDRPCALVVDSDGNVYVTGTSVGSGTGDDYATIKYEPDGGTAWVRRYRPGDYDDAYAIAVDDSGNVYVTGASWGSTETRDDYATIKYKPNGDTAWVRRYNGPASYYDEARAIAVDGSGNVYVTGYVGRQSGPPWEDYATIKYYPNGDSAWVRTYNGPGNENDRPYAMAIDNSGNVCVTGGSPGSGTSLDYATIKYYPNGDGAWLKRYDGPANSGDAANAIAVDGSGNVYVTGVSDNDYATIKYDRSGNQLWVKRYNGPGNLDDCANAIAVDDSGNIYVTGQSGVSEENSDYATIKYHQYYLTDGVTVVGFSPIDLIVTDPEGDSIGLAFNTIPGADYDTTQDYNHDGDKDDIVTIPNRLVGLYIIRVFAEPTERGVYSLGIRIDGSDMVMLATGQPSPSPDEADTFFYNAPWYLRGDANGDWVVNVTDVVYLINYLFIGGPGPELWQTGDANCDETINVSDVVYLINYLFISGPPPCN